MTAAQKIDKLVEAAYYRMCSGIAIDMLDIGRVFAEGRRAYVAGEDLDNAVSAFVQTIRRN